MDEPGRKILIAVLPPEAQLPMAKAELYKVPVPDRTHKASLMGSSRSPKRETTGTGPPLALLKLFD